MSSINIGFVLLSGIGVYIVVSNILCKLLVDKLTIGLAKYKYLRYYKKRDNYVTETALVGGFSAQNITPAGSLNEQSDSYLLLMERNICF